MAWGRGKGCMTQDPPVDKRQIKQNKSTQGCACKQQSVLRPGVAWPGLFWLVLPTYLTAKFIIDEAVSCGWSSCTLCPHPYTSFS